MTIFVNLDNQQEIELHNGYENIDEILDEICAYDFVEGAAGEWIRTDRIVSVYAE